MVYRPGRVLLVLLILGLCAGCGATSSDVAAPIAAGPLLPDRFVRAPDVKTDMDTNPANLASAVVTYSFGQLPEYIDGAAFRLLPHDMSQTSEPGRTTRRIYRLTVPRTRLVLDTAVTASPTMEEARRLARTFRVRVSLDGRYVRSPDRYWVFYRNNGAQICRIYFPGDLGSLNMGANSMVFHPLAPGAHRLRVELDRTLAGSTARLLAEYRLQVLARPPNAAERATAPPEDGPGNRIPLTFRNDHPELLTSGH